MRVTKICISNWLEISKDIVMRIEKGHYNETEENSHVATEGFNRKIEG